MLEHTWIIGALVLLVGSAGAYAIFRVVRGLETDAGSLQAGLPPTDAASFFTGLARSRQALSAALSSVFSSAVDSQRFEALEEALIGADIGVKTAVEIVGEVEKAKPADELATRSALRGALLERLAGDHTLATGDGSLLVVLVVGVNGSGKTTTIGKLASQYISSGKKVLLAAGDTFRAGAIEQLKVWGERVGAEVVAHGEGADTAAVLYDGIKAGIARGADVVICDTAGRLQAQSALMDELGKVLRVMDKALPGAPHEVLLVLDATIGQNALSQARAFMDVVGATGVVLTKLDGTARGGVVVAVKGEMGLPVKLIGLGEGVEDLRPFDPEAFVDALLATEESPPV